VSEVHGAGGSHRQPDRAQNVPRIRNTKELVRRRRCVEVRRLLVDEKRVRNPHRLQELGADLTHANSDFRELSKFQETFQETIITESVLTPSGPWNMSRGSFHI
jgi:hypothetical protein